MINTNIFPIKKVIYSTCLTVQEAMLWIGSWNWQRYLHGALSPFCFPCKDGSCFNPLSFPLREQSYHREKAENASPSTAGECFVSGIHDSNPPVQECCPTLGQKASADQAKITSFLRNSQTLLIQKDWGGKGSKMETWKEKNGNSSSPKRTELKS